MNNFMELNEYSKKILSSLTNSDIISRLVYYNKPDALEKKIDGTYLYDKPQASDLTYTLVYPYKFVPNLSIVDVLMFNSIDQISKCLESYKLI
jgi:hypothetical protein